MREHPCVEVAFGDTVKATCLHLSYHHKSKLVPTTRSPNLLSTSLSVRQPSDQVRQAELIVVEPACSRAKHESSHSAVTG